MKSLVAFFSVFLFSNILFAQVSVSGSVLLNSRPLQGVSLVVEGEKVAETNQKGEFQFKTSKVEFLLLVEKQGLVTKKFPMVAKSEIKNFLIQMEIDAIEENKANVISLSESELEEDENASADMVSGLLQSSRDIFHQRASFDFGQVFFRPRGYDSKDANVLINGIPMQKVETHRAQWSHWGGLNDATRNQTTTIGVGASEGDFGGVFGSQFINISPSLNRAGSRVSLATSNRSYVGRLMATYNSGLLASGLSYTISASRRFTQKGNYIDGMLYNAYAVLGAVEYKANPYFKVNFVGAFSYNHRGKSAPLTQEAIALGGRHYNPNWGYLNGDIRNSKMKRIAEPFFILSHTFNKKSTKINTNLAYQFGQVGDSRIQYVKSQNPDPSYYTNMPSYYYRNHNPSDLLSHDPFAEDKTARQIDYFRQNKQLNWESLYFANKSTNGESLYTENEDVIDTKTLTANVLFSQEITKNIKLNLGLTYQNIRTDNFQQIKDLLGGNYLLNKSYFANFWYNTENEWLKEGDRYQYSYLTNTNKLNGFGELVFNFKKAEFFVAAKFDHTSYERQGLFENQGVYQDSKGKSGEKYFNSISTKAGLNYSLTGRHILQLTTGYFEVPQPLNAIFMNIRQSNSVLPISINAENQITADASYIIRMPYFKQKLTAYFTKIENGIEKNFFFTQARLGDESAGFLSETMANIKKNHYGIEWGAEVQIIPTLKATAVASVGEYRYANNPLLMYSSDKALISEVSTTYLKNYRLATGPQQAYSLGLEYRSPKYWWVGVTGNFFRKNFVDVAPLLRTSNIYLNPTTGSVFDNIDEAKVAELLKQEELKDLFLMNLSAGKSWRIKDKYISLFASVNNLLNTQFKAGGFEQARQGNYQAMLQDRANGYPVFGNKYFVGYGATYFVNLAVSF